MTVSKIRLPDNTEHDIRAKYLIQSSSSDAVSEEFVTKVTTEDAIANIQKIYGNTIKWNQLLQNGNFDGLTGWTAHMSATASVNNNVVTVTKSDSSSGLGGILYTATTGQTSHKYYIAGSLCTNSSGVSIFLGFQTTSYTVGGNSYLEGSTSSFQRLSMVTSPKNSTDKIMLRVGTGAAAVGSSGRAKELICVDLTDLYGSGNEPTAAQFEATYPYKYSSYLYPTSFVSLCATSIQSKDSNNNVIGNCDINIPTLTGKLNGAGSSVILFPNGMQSNGTTRDEMAATSAIKRIADDNSVLSTPQTYVLDNALQLQYPMVAGGTEMLLPTTDTAPMKMDVIYGNAADAAATMPQNFISVDSMKEFLAALGTQMGGTWSMGYENGKHTFTFTSN